MGLELLGDEESEELVRTNVGGVATLCDITVRSIVVPNGVGRAIGVDDGLAVLLVAALAFIAGQARADLSTDANTVTDLDRLDVVTDLNGSADNLMSNN